MASAVRNYKEVEKVIKEKVPDTVTLTLTQDEVNVLYGVTSAIAGSPQGPRGQIDNIRAVLKAHVSMKEINFTGVITLY